MIVVVLLGDRAGQTLAQLIDIDCAVHIRLIDVRYVIIAVLKHIGKVVGVGLADRGRVACPALRKQDFHIDAALDDG